MHLDNCTISPSCSAFDQFIKCMAWLTDQLNAYTQSGFRSIYNLLHVTANYVNTVVKQLHRHLSSSNGSLVCTARMANRENWPNAHDIIMLTWLINQSRQHIWQTYLAVTHKAVHNTQTSISWRWSWHLHQKKKQILSDSWQQTTNINIKCCIIPSYVWLPMSLTQSWF